MDDRLTIFFSRLDSRIPKYATLRYFCPSRAVTQRGRTIAQKQEIQCFSQYQEIGMGVRADVARCVVQIEFTSTGDVNMTGWLVCTGIEAEVEHHGSRVLGSVDIGAAISVAHVIAEESALELLEDIDTVGNEPEGVDGFYGLRVNITAGSGLSGESLVLDGYSVKGNSIVSHDITSRYSGNIENLIVHQGQSVPITVLVDIGGRNVNEGAKTGVNGLNRPLELRQEDGVGGNRHSLSLESVNADEGETNSLNENVVNFGVNKDVVSVQFHSGNLLVGIDVGAGCQHWGQCDPLLDVSDGNSSGGTLTSGGGSLLLNGQLQEQVSGGSEENVALSLNIDDNETLAIRNGYGGYSESRIAIEPEDHG